MSLQVIVIASDPANTTKVVAEDFTLVETLGPSEEAIAVRINDVMEAVSEQVRSSITTESELIVEVTGSVVLKAQGGAKWLFLNVGGGAEKSDSLKVTLKTKIRPD